MGGIGIVVVAVIGGAIVAGREPRVWILLAAFLLVAIVSLRDDLKPLRARTRFAVQIAAAAIIIAGCGYWQTIVIAGNEIPLGIAGIVLTAIWIVGVTNAFNFMDGIDGIAGGQAVVAAIGWALLARTRGDETTFWLALIVGAAAFGFLLENWWPARIFMGDVASAALGLFFASSPSSRAATRHPRRPRRPHALAIPLRHVLHPRAPPVARRDIVQAHRSHLYQRLVIAGLSHAKVSALYIVLAAEAWSRRSGREFLRWPRSRVQRWRCGCSWLWWSDDRMRAMRVLVVTRAGRQTCAATNRVGLMLRSAARHRTHCTRLHDARAACRVGRSSAIGRPTGHARTIRRLGGWSMHDTTANRQAGEAAVAAFARAHDRIPLSARCERRDGGVKGRIPSVIPKNEAVTPPSPRSDTSVRGVGRRRSDFATPVQAHISARHWVATVSFFKSQTPASSPPCRSSYARYISVLPGTSIARRRSFACSYVAPISSSGRQLS
jgi:hypothetical protein